MSTQLADKSVKYLRGIIKDVLVKIDKFIFPIDFVILNMDKDVKVPLILGWPFLATTNAIIDVSDGQLILKVGEEEVIFKIFNAMNDDFDITVFGFVHEIVHTNPLKACIM